MSAAIQQPAKSKYVEGSLTITRYQGKWKPKKQVFSIFVSYEPHAEIEIPIQTKKS